MRGQLLAWLVAIALAVEVVSHVALLIGLVARRPRWRAAAALLLPPLAPVWGWKAGMHRLVVVWVIALGAYALGVVLAA